MSVEPSRMPHGTVVTAAIKVAASDGVDWDTATMAEQDRYTRYATVALSVGLNLTQPPLWPIGEGQVMTALAKGFPMLVIRAVPDGYGKESGYSREQAWQHAEASNGPKTILYFKSAEAVSEFKKNLTKLEQSDWSQYPAVPE